MPIQQIIDEQMQEFEKEFSDYIKTISIGQYDNSGANVGFLAAKDVILKWHTDVLRKLIEAVGEEIISEGERIYDNGAYGDEACEGDECHFESGYLVARDVLEGQQLKLKEIINSLK